MGDVPVSAFAASWQALTHPVMPPVDAVEVDHSHSACLSHEPPEQFALSPGFDTEIGGFRRTRKAGMRVPEEYSHQQWFMCRSYFTSVCFYLGPLKLWSGHVEANFQAPRVRLINVAYLSDKGIDSARALREGHGSRLFGTCQHGTHNAAIASKAPSAARQSVAILRAARPGSGSPG